MYVCTHVDIFHANHRSYHRYLHLGFRAQIHLVEQSRVSLLWAIMRLRHPLLASKVKMNDYEDIRFL